MYQVTFKSSVTGLSLFGFTWLNETSGGETLATQFNHVFVSYICANQLRAEADLPVYLTNQFCHSLLKS